MFPFSTIWDINILNSFWIISAVPPGCARVIEMVDAKSTTFLYESTTRYSPSTKITRYVLKLQQKPRICFQSQNTCTICHYYEFSFDSLKSRTWSNERLFFFVFPGILYIWTKHTWQSTQQPKSRHIEIWNFKEKIKDGKVWIIHEFLQLKSGNNTKTITSKISNWFHVDENINTLEISGVTVS